MIAPGAPETEEDEREHDDLRRALIADDLVALASRGEVPRVALHKLLTKKGDGLHAAYYLAAGGERLYMCALRAATTREAQVDLLAWLAGAAGFAPTDVALDLEAAEDIALGGGAGTPWPDGDLLARLASAADHLLTVHDCDCVGHEEVRAAVRAARARRPA